LHAADGGKDIARRAAELHGGAALYAKGAVPQSRGRPHLYAANQLKIGFSFRRRVCSSTREVKLRRYSSDAFLSAS